MLTLQYVVNNISKKQKDISRNKKKNRDPTFPPKFGWISDFNPRNKGLPVNIFSCKMACTLLDIYPKTYLKAIKKSWRKKKYWHFEIPYPRFLHWYDLDPVYKGLTRTLKGEKTTLHSIFLSAFWYGDPPIINEQHIQKGDFYLQG